MDSGEMEALMRAGGYSLAVDATHPYAVEVTEHIRAAAEAAGLPVLRLQCGSPTAGALPQGKGHGRGGGHAGADARSCCSPPAARSSTTLPAPDWQSGAIPGAAHGGLPGAVPDPGLSPKNIICMQGPFSRELNVALLRQYHIQTPVTRRHRGGTAASGKRRRLPGRRAAPCWWWSAPAGRPA